jgi:hypothetical protein
MPIVIRHNGDVASWVDEALVRIFSALTIAPHRECGFSTKCWKRWRTEGYQEL